MNDDGLMMMDEDASSRFTEATSNDNIKGMSISTRPEIRKGCVWDVLFAFDRALLDANEIRKIFFHSAPDDESAFLCLKARSKLIKPTVELAFPKVAKIVNPGEFVIPNEHGLVVLKVRFTARPRAVFHKHADVMILVAALKIGERVVCADELELVFRGGTGSVHGAEGREGRSSHSSFPDPSHQPAAAPSFPIIFSAHQLQQMSLQAANPTLSAPMIGGNVDNSYFKPSSNNSIAQGLPSAPLVMTPSSFLSDATNWDAEMTMPQFDTINSADLRDDFLQNKGDALLLNPSSLENSMNMNMSSFNDSNEWQENLDGSFSPPLLDSQRAPAITKSTSSTSSASTPSAPTPSSVASSPATAQPFTVVFDKKRSSCCDCVGECSYYKGSGGPCNECGCYPARHLDLDAPKPAKNLKRSASAAGLDDTRESGNKKPRFLLEAKFFQKLFFSCMQYMTLPEIARVANSAPIPLFVKDEKTDVYIYINPTFCHFITDLSKTERVLNHTPGELFSQDESDVLVEHDRILKQHGEGTVKTFDVSIRKQEFRVMKEYCSLRDGKKVILGAVISSL